MADPPPGYASDPTLEMLWTTPPSLTGLTASGSTSKSPPLSSPFAIDLGSLREGEQQMLSSVQDVVNVYNPIEQQVQGIIAGNTFFGQWAQPPGYREVSIPHSMPTDPLAEAAQQFAAQINPAMTRALRLVADTMEAFGIFIAMLNTSGQAYTSSDKNSAVPPPTTTGS